MENATQKEAEILTKTENKSRSFFLILNDPNRDVLKIQSNIASMMTFIDSQLNHNHDQKENEKESKIENENETLFLIQVNLKFLSCFLSDFHMSLSNNARTLEYSYHIVERREIELQWLEAGMGLHTLCLNIIKNYKNEAWLNLDNGNNAKCIFYALLILKSLCLGQSEHNISKILNNELIYIVLDIMNGAMSWLEQMISAQLLTFFLIHSKDAEIWIKLYITHKLNVVELMIKTCCNCFKLPYFYETMEQYQKDIISIYKGDFEDISNIKSKDDLPTYVRSQYSNQNEVTKSLHIFVCQCRVDTVRCLSMFAHKHRNNNRFINTLIKPMESIYFKRFLQVTTMTMRQGTQTYPPSQNSINMIVILSLNFTVAKKLVSDDEIIENLIISLRSRSAYCEYNYREIVVILYYIIYEHQLLPKKYYHDMILALMDIRELEWKNFSLLNLHPLRSLNTLILRCLKYLFQIAAFKRINSEKYICSICLEEFEYPQTLPCNHSLCYVCLTALIASGYSKFDAWFARHNIKPSTCPMCRKEFDGRFDRDDSKSAFVLNKQLLNEMHSGAIVVDGHDEFKGTEYEYWEYLKMNHTINDNIIQDEFIEFCDFMKLKTRVFFSDDINKELMEKILKAKEIKKNGNKLFGERKYEAAIKKYKKALVICPLFHSDRATYYSNIGLCYLQIKDYVNAFRAAQNGSALCYTHCKLLSTAITALHKLLPTILIEKTASLYPYIHSQNIVIGESNELSANRRIYDIILYQLLWDCHLRYCDQMLATHEDTREYLAELNETDRFLIRLKNIEKSVSNYKELNYEEFQYIKYLKDIDNIKQLCQVAICTVMKENNKSCMLLDEIVEFIQFEFEDNKKNEFLSQFASKEALKKIIKLTPDLEMIDEKVELLLQSDKNKLIAMANARKKPTNKAMDAYFKFTNNWEENDVDIVHAPIYRWEQKNNQEEKENL